MPDVEKWCVVLSQVFIERHYIDDLMTIEVYIVLHRYINKKWWIVDIFTYVKCILICSLDGTIKESQLMEICSFFISDIK